MFGPTRGGWDHWDMLTYVHGARWKLYSSVKWLKYQNGMTKSSPMQCHGIISHA